MAAATLRPPKQLNDVELAEWKRMVAALKAEGRTLSAKDAPLLTLYVDVWARNRNASQMMTDKGTIIKWKNDTVSPSPFYKIWIETTRQIRGLLRELGCDSTATSDAAPSDLDF